jgi:twitching motility protein PilT
MSVEKLAHQVGRLLVEQDLLGAADCDRFADRASRNGENLLALVVSDGAVPRSEILRVVAAKLGWDFFEPGPAFEPPQAAIARLPREAAAAHTALPVAVDGRGRLVVAVDDPFDDERLGAVTDAASGEVTFVLGPRDELEAAVPAAYAVRTRIDGRAAPHPASSGERRLGTDNPAIHIDELLAEMLDMGASDLHLTAGSPPQVRVDGSLRKLDGFGRLMPPELRTMVYSILTSQQREQLEERLELDCSHSLAGRARFRVNVYQQRGSVGAVLRAIPNSIKSLEELGMPPVAKELAMLSRGLVLVTGATGAGKTTTLAAMIDVINSNRQVHIMTIEDPIEFMHPHRKAIVNQREVGTDTHSFASALRHALRQDPDVILVGELRDLETIETAITAAETGHLVLGTLHTQDAPQTIERIIDVFPPNQQVQVRVQLSGSIQGVVSQVLIPAANSSGRVAGVEVMVATPAIRNLIREGKVHQIRSAMQAGARHGMQTMDQSLARLVRNGRITLAAATERASNTEDLLNLIGGK